MPTAARLVAALALACVCPLMYFLVNSQYPDLRLELEREPLMGMLAVVGFLVGWLSLGKRVTTKLGNGIFLGIRAAVTIAVWSVFLCALYYIVDQMLDHGFYEPLDAILAMFGKMTDYARYLLNWRIIALALFAGMTIGMLTENTARRWR